MDVRPADDEDLPRLAELHSETLGGPSLAATIDHLRALPLVFISEEEGQIIGLVSGQLAADECEIHSLAVIESARRRGLGRALVLALEVAAREAGATVCHLEVRADNQAARTLYSELGYTVSGRRPTNYKDGEEAVLMRRDLEEPTCGG